jgi:hypothetical protein
MESLKHDTLKIGNQLDQMNTSTIEGLRSTRGGDKTRADYLGDHLSSISQDAVAAAFVGCSQIEGQIGLEIESGRQMVSKKVSR